MHVTLALLLLEDLIVFAGMLPPTPETPRSESPPRKAVGTLADEARFLNRLLRTSAHVL